MAERNITRQRLEFLLENWGLFATTGEAIIRVPTQCGSVERRWNDNPSRFGHGERAYISRGTPDDGLGLVVERCVLALEPRQQRALLLHYGHLYTSIRLAATLHISPAAVEALVATAAIAVWEMLEAEACRAA